MGDTLGAFGRYQPASWNGVPFAVLGQEHKTGRKTAVHDYPFRDEVWVEDLGRAIRGKRVNGFLVGDDVPAQREAMREAVERPGEGVLVLPTEGRLACTLVGYADTEAWDEGRVVRLSFEFVQGGVQGLALLPVADDDTAAGVADAADEAADAVEGAWLDDVGVALSSGFGAAQAAVAEVDAYVGTAQRLVGDASRVVGAVNGLAGRFGRYVGGAVSGALAPVTNALGAAQGAIGTVRATEAAVTGTLHAATAVRASVDHAAADVTRLGGLL